MDFSEIQQYKAEIQAEFDALVDSRRVFKRTNSKQWKFFQHCFSVLMGEIAIDFTCEDSQTVQYVYEVNKALQKYYQSFGKPINYTFSLIHQNKTEPLDFEENDYPSCNRYFLQVAINKKDYTQMQSRRLLIGKTVAEAIAAELRAYQGIPEVFITEIRKIFDVDGPAYKDIYARILQRRNSGYTLQNTDNPSYNRLIAVNIKNFKDDSAEVRTKEFWLIMWWSNKNERYEYTYKEENYQTYILQWRNERWIVVENRYKKPTISTPKRVEKLSGI